VCHCVRALLTLRAAEALGLLRGPAGHVEGAPAPACIPGPTGHPLYMFRVAIGSETRGKTRSAIG
jgi:hypothetical protein